MRSLVLIALIAGSVSAQLACNQPTQHYITMGCIPGDALSEDGCPLSYVCPNLSDRQPDKCYLFGQVYDIGQKLPQEQSYSTCESLSCEFNEYTGKAYIRIDYNGCAYPWAPECVTQYRPGQCCPTGVICGNQIKQLAKCSESGTNYYEGEQIYTEFDSCESCVCSRNYSASGSRPVGFKECVEKRCPFEIFDSYSLLNGGAPVYRKGGCCPYYWRLPTDKDAIAYQNYDAYGPTCTYGNLTLNVGDSLVPLITYSGVLKCECAIPPLVSCTLEKDHISK